MKKKLKKIPKFKSEDDFLINFGAVAPFYCSELSGIREELI